MRLRACLKNSEPDQAKNAPPRAFTAKFATGCGLLSCLEPSSHASAARTGSADISFRTFMSEPPPCQRGTICCTGDHAIASALFRLSVWPSMPIWRSGRLCPYGGLMVSLRPPVIIERSPHADFNIEQLALFDPKADFNRRAIHSDVPPTPRRISWRRLLARVFSIDLTRCPLCEGPLKIIEAVVDPARIAVLLDPRREIQAREAREAREAVGQTGRDAAEVGRNLDDAGTCSKPRVRESGCGLRGPPPPSVERCEADEQLELFIPR